MSSLLTPEDREKRIEEILADPKTADLLAQVLHADGGKYDPEFARELLQALGEGIKQVKKP